ncbi:hypothetical protein [Ornithinimicrobium flavum]|uniref:hypothetical protein n=1 Tax=Ornithinimicrobium flavum TaxID=1288636 RepID=UPI00106F8E1A|nr:hypothetical protein [Ornithinimicrobium flavum]
MSTTSRGPSRRTLVKGAAWSVPVVAVAGAAPAMAASQEVWFENLGIACKLPGASCQRETGVTKGYVIRTRVCTNVRSDVSITFENVAVSLNGGPSTPWTVSPNPLEIEYTGTVPQCQIVDLAIQGEPDSANGTIYGTGTYTWTSESGLSGSGTIEFSAEATPPCVNCEPPPPGAVPASDAETGTVAPSGSDTAKTESITPVEPSTDASKTDEASQTTAP